MPPTLGGDSCIDDLLEAPALRTFAQTEDLARALVVRQWSRRALLGLQLENLRHHRCFSQIGLADGLFVGRALALQE